MLASGFRILWATTGTNAASVAFFSARSNDSRLRMSSSAMRLNRLLPEIKPNPTKQAAYEYQQQNHNLVWEHQVMKGFGRDIMRENVAAA
jgi:hypothetical protein